MTRVLVAFDKFKDALTARQACDAAARGLQTAHPDWELDLCPLTDGGEGFCETLTRAARGRLLSVMCSGPRGRQIDAPIGVLDAENLSIAIRSKLQLRKNSLLAVIEMASASGVSLLSFDQRDPWETSSRGTGEQIQAAVHAGAQTILLGVGGSATNDLGFGALAAWGFQFLDIHGATIASPTPATWEKIIRIKKGTITPLPPLFIACDVSNPLLGPTGAAAIFGPQKGLRAADLPKLERQTERLAGLLAESCGQTLVRCDEPGAGAAGGFAFGLAVAAQAKLLSGSELVFEWLGLPARIAAADIVLTGEGRFDATSLGGKGTGSLVMAAQRSGKQVHVFAGSIESPLPAKIKTHAITPSSLSLVEALPRTAELLTSAVAMSV